MKSHFLLVLRSLVIKKAILFVLLSTTTTVFAQGPLASIEITPSNVILTVGQQQEFSVVGKDDQGNTVALIDPQVQGTGGTMTVNHDPVTGITTVTYTAGQQTGNYYIEVWDAAVTGPPGTAGAIWGSADIVISADPPELTTIEVTPSPVTLNFGEQQQFTATGKDQYGNDYDEFTREWTATGGNITSGGLYTAGQQPGDYTVTCTAQGTSISGTASVHIQQDPPELTSIEVTPSPVTLNFGEQQQFTATGKDQYGNDYDEFTREWTATGGTITSGGLYTAGQQTGDYTVTCTAQGTSISGTASVHINQAPPVLTSIEIVPSNVTLNVGDDQQFTATGQDQYGNNYDEFTREWSATGGNIISGGIYTAGQQPGDYTVTCTAQGTSIYGTASVHINQAPPVLTSIEIVPSNVTLNVGDDQQFTATGQDQYGNNYNEFTPEWTATGGTITPGGDNPIKTLPGNSFTAIYTALLIGDHIVVCTDSASGIADTAQVHVTSSGIFPNGELPDKFILFRNFPNPFNSETTIHFNVKKTCHVSLKVINLLGREIAVLANSRFTPGIHEVVFDSRELSSGLYFYTIRMKGFYDIKKMILMK